MARYKYQKTNYTSYIVILLVGLLIGFALTSLFFSVEPEKEVAVVPEEPLKKMYAEINLVAVDQEGNGVSTPLTVEAIPGDGKVLTDIEKLLFWVDTQYSIQTARNVAINITKKNMNDYDLIYSIKTEATLVGGPSAGAALTLATIAALQNKTLKNDIIITGTVDPDGSIGQVGGVLEKAQAASDVGIKVFLVPPGQGEEVYLRPNETCERKAGFIFCETIYEQVTINIGDSVGISVIEVENIKEAMAYFGL
ncbi:MAG: S16 family serine protease [Candidatus Aenigmatarchaeota archaeon]